MHSTPQTTGGGGAGPDGTAGGDGRGGGGGGPPGRRLCADVSVRRVPYYLAGAGDNLDSVALLVPSLPA
eukprot:250615-Prorocentrum_minimum.AAC.6